MCVHTYLLYPFIHHWILAIYNGHHHLAIVNNAIMSIRVHVSFQLVFLFSSDKYSEVELLDDMLALL